MDSLIIAHHYGFLSDVELLCLEQELTTNDHHQSNYPYKQYRPFNWDQYDEHTCKTELRFEKSDIPRLQRCLGIPNKLQFYKGSYCLGLEALYIILRRLAYPVRYCDMVPRFGRSVPDLCKITHLTINHIFDQVTHTYFTVGILRFYAKRHSKVTLMQHMRKGPLEKLFWFR